MEDEIAVKVDGWVSPSIYQCRICHEEEEESASKSIEAPCSCSGTVKFAHRECIQRWCDEKGNTICEICLQKFEPGYTIPKKARLADVAVTIRESLEVPRQGYELHGIRLMAIAAEEVETLDPDYAECSSATERSASCCRSVAIIFTILLLVRYLSSWLNGGSDHYAFALLASLLLRAAGVLLPLYIIMRIIEAIRHRQHQQQQYEAAISSLEEADEEDDNDDEQIEYTVQIIQ